MAGNNPEAIERAVALLRVFEGLGDGDRRTPLLDPYRCPAGHMTIGYGHVIRDKLGVAVIDAAEARRLYDGGVTPAFAEALLAADVASFAERVQALVSVPLTARQLAVLISFAFNVGIGAFKVSTLRRRLNAGDYGAVAARAADGTLTGELLRWTKVRGVDLAGLVVRRQAEATAWIAATEGRPDGHA